MKKEIEFDINYFDLNIHKSSSNNRDETKIYTLSGYSADKNSSISVEATKENMGKLNIDTDKKIDKLKIKLTESDKKDENQLKLTDIVKTERYYSNKENGNKDSVDEPYRKKSIIMYLSMYSKEPDDLEDYYSDYCSLSLDISLTEKEYQDFLKNPGTGLFAIEFEIL